MEIREIQSKDEWEGFLQNCAEKTFMQSWNWGEFNIALHNKIWQFGIFYGENLLGVFLVIKVTAKRGTFLFVPHGPVLKESLRISDKKETMKGALEMLKKISAEEKNAIIKVS